MSSPVAMEGYMMKRRGGGGEDNGRRGLLRRAVGLREWDRRYFVLLDDGRLVYHRGRHGKNAMVVCADVAECTREPIVAVEVGSDPMDRVANSFRVINNSTGARTLLVTNGPEDYRRWMTAFRKLKVVRGEDDDAAARAAAGENIAKTASAITAASSAASEPVAVAEKGKSEEEAEPARPEKETLERERSATGVRLWRRRGRDKGCPPPSVISFVPSAFAEDDDDVSLI